MSMLHFTTESTIELAFKKLEKFCKRENFKGYDPFDGLNSSWFQSIPHLRDNRLARLAWLQLFKRSPINFRSWVGVKKEYNPKALGLFLSSYCQLYELEQRPEYLEKIDKFIQEIKNHRSKAYAHSCWGYNFDWQSRAFYQPKDTPTVVASTFVAHALLDAFEIVKDQELLSIAKSTCDFIMNDLNRTYDLDTFAFSYSPLDKSVVYNASLLGSRLLARVYSYTNESVLSDTAKKSVAYCCNRQNSNGSWGYGTLGYHQWIDSFHTGYNLECIADYMKYTGDWGYQGNVTHGFNYYINNFFTEEGIPKYYNNSVFPIDVHAPAQLIITLIRLNKFGQCRALVDKVLLWTINNMQTENGNFYYQIDKFHTSKIPYMRWSQAWMFFAFSHYLRQVGNNINTVTIHKKVSTI